MYALALSPAPDGSVWGTTLGFPGAIIRLSPGSNPPHTALTEVFEVPWNNPGVATQGFSPRGGDVDRNGVYWTAMASGHMASFDRRKCRGPLNGPIRLQGLHRLIPACSRTCGGHTVGGVVGRPLRG